MDSEGFAAIGADSGGGRGLRRGAGFGGGVVDEKAEGGTEKG
jgi:hypothetical protein